MTNRFVGFSVITAAMNCTARVSLRIGCNSAC
jgi:hypothetical protein